MSRTYKHVAGTWAVNQLPFLLSLMNGIQSTSISICHMYRYSCTMSYTCQVLYRTSWNTCYHIPDITGHYAFHIWTFIHTILHMDQNHILAITSCSRRYHYTSHIWAINIHNTLLCIYTIQIQFITYKHLSVITHCLYFIHISVLRIIIIHHTVIIRVNGQHSLIMAHSRHSSYIYIAIILS